MMQNIESNNNPKILIKTGLGNIRIQIFAKQAPITTARPPMTAAITIQPLAFMNGRPLFMEFFYDS